MLNLIISLLQKIFLLGHLQSGSFPKPLSEKEELILLERYEKYGDVEAKNKLIEHNLRLVAHIVKKYAGNQDEADDFLSIGTIGLIKGINTFTTDKKTRLSTYVAKCIHNEILMVLRAKKHLPSEVSLSESIGSDKEGNEVTLMDIIPSEDEEIEVSYEKKLKIKKLYESIKDCLDDREKKIVELRYGLIDGKAMPQRKIAKRLNISRSYVSRIEKKAVEKLKDALINLG
ncbi:MAG: RNA polymerase sporulation sigma factor SigK [Clostridia bacterium]|nr:RNA polymerase sporulation sigma factor SigK [Clostridia bacterium]